MESEYIFPLILVYHICQGKAPTLVEACCEEVELSLHSLTKFSITKYYYCYNKVLSIIIGKLFPDTETTKLYP